MNDTVLLACLTQAPYGRPFSTSFNEGLSKAESDVKHSAVTSLVFKKQAITTKKKLLATLARLLAQHVAKTKKFTLLTRKTREKYL